MVKNLASIKSKTYKLYLTMINSISSKSDRAKMIPLKYISLIRCEHEGVVTLSLSLISRLWTKKRSKLIKTITQRITIQRGNIKNRIIFPFRGVMKYHHVTLYKQMDQIYQQELLNELNRKFSLWYLVCIIKYFYNARSMQGFVVY